MSLISNQIIGTDYFFNIIKNPINPGITAFTNCDTKETRMDIVGDIFIKLKKYRIAIASPEPKPLSVNGNK